MNWLALSKINNYEIVTRGLYTFVYCPEHAEIGYICTTGPVKLREIFKLVSEHSDEKHNDTGD